MKYDRAFQSIADFKVTAYADGAEAKHFIINQFEVTSIRISSAHAEET